MSLKNKMNEFSPTNKIIVTGHRGAAGLAPENTLSSLRIGLTYADRIEIDVHQTKDGHIVVMHDATVNRTTNGRGRIKNMTLKELRELDAGYWFGEEFIGEKIPTLEEAIDVVCEQKILLIEIKDHKYKNIEEKVIEIIKSEKVEAKVIVQSFSNATLQRLHSIDPNIELHKLFVRAFHLFNFTVMLSQTVWFYNFKKFGYISEFSMYHRLNGKHVVKFLDSKSGGKKINVWVENDVLHSKDLICFGVDGLITDFPDRFHKGSLKKLASKSL